MCIESKLKKTIILFNLLAIIITTAEINEIIEIKNNIWKIWRLDSETVKSLVTMIIIKIKRKI